MSINEHDTRPREPNLRRGSAAEATSGALTAEARRGHTDDGATSAAPAGGTRAGLRDTLQAIAGEIDGLWRDALESQDFDLVTRAVDASHGVHRALLALADRSVIGAAPGPGHDASRLGHIDRAPS